MKKLRLVLLASMLACGLSANAGADPITTTYNFSTAFLNGPTALIIGSITLTFDPTTAGAINVVDFSSPILQGFMPVTAVHNGNSVSALAFGNHCSGAGCSGGTAGSFWDILNINAAGDVTSTGTGLYNPSGSYYFGTTTYMRVPAVTAPVPEPAAWAMMILGIGAIGFATRRQKVATRVSYAA